MSVKQRLRGLVGTALIWGGIASALGIGVFVAVFRPWPISREHWEGALMLFGKWEAASLLWGIACGTVFGLTMILLERRRHLRELSATRITVWGAIGGALFPTLLSIRPILSGASPIYFGLIIGGSALAGALWARASFAIARRAPDAADRARAMDFTPEALTPETSPQELAVHDTIGDAIRSKR
jgi:hypothetical protein